ILLPSSSVAILHVVGTTWCRHNSDDPKTYLTLKNQKILTTGTIVGLVTGPNGSVVKVVEGTVTASALVGGRTVSVAANRQLAVPPSGVPKKATSLVLTPEDQLAVSELRND